MADAVDDTTVSNMSGVPEAITPPHHEFGTMSVHAGERSGRPRVSDSLTTPIVCTATYSFKNTEQLIAYQEGRHASFEYGRLGNPTTRAAEEKIRELEGAEDCGLSASGMNSATTMLLALVPQGGHIVITNDCYQGTREFIQTVLPKMGVTTTIIDPSDLKSLQATLDSHEVSLFFSESPTNPFTRCVDIPAISKMCRAKGAIVCIDSTFASPINQQAIALGADIVIHSATKYLSGHHDLQAGAIAGRADLVKQIKQLHHTMGGVLDPHAAYLLIRGMKTLELRMERHNANGMTIATRLSAHPKVSRVHYPGLESHRDHQIAVRQMKGFGGVVSFEINGDLQKTSKFVDSCRLPYMAPSLGGVETLIVQPRVDMFWNETAEKRAEYNITDNLVRISLGIENVEDIWADLSQALDKI